MARWEEKRKSDARPRPVRESVSTPTKARGKDLRRGGGVRNRDPFVLPTIETPRISTPRNGRRPTPEPESKDQKTAAPASPAVPRGQNLPGGNDPNKSAAQPGTGPKGNTVGSDADPNTPGLQGPGAPGARVNANGLLSYGRDLSSLNAFTSAFTGGYELSDIKTAFKSNDLEGAYQTGSNTIANTGDKYELPDSQTPLTGGNNYAGAEGVKAGETSYTLPEASVPGTVGRANTAQDGTSGKPDVADQIRQVRMRRKGPRDEGSFRGFQIDQANEFAQNSVSQTKGNGMNAKRRAVRDAFFDMDLNSVQAGVAAAAVAGRGTDSDGRSVFNYGGKLVYAKDGMENKANNASSMGQDPTPYLAIPTTPETLPDSPAPSELSPSFAKETPGAQEFFKGAIKKVKEQNK